MVLENELEYILKFIFVICYMINNIVYESIVFVSLINEVVIQILFMLFVILILIFVMIMNCYGLVICWLYVVGGLGWWDL